MKRILPILLFAVTAATAALRAAPPSQPSVEKLATLMQVDKLHDTMLNNLMQSFDGSIKRVLRGAPPTAADQAVVAASRTRIVSLVDQGLSGEDIKAMYETVYTETYTQEEVDSMIAFYSTPMGQKIATAQLQVPFNISTEMQKPMARIGTQLQMAIFSAVQKVAQAHVPKAAPAVPPKPAVAAVTPTAAASQPAPAPKGN